MFLQKLVAAIENEKVPFAVVGGYAVSLHGAVRGTVDIDIIIEIVEESFVAIESAMQKLGLQSRLPVTAREAFFFRKEYIEKRNMIAWSFVDNKNPAHIVDIIITEDLKRKKIIYKKMGSVSIPVLSIPDLIKMKSSTNREQDRADIEALKELLQKGSKK